MWLQKNRLYGRIELSQITALWGGPPSAKCEHAEIVADDDPLYGSLADMVETTHALLETPVGILTLVGTEEAVLGLYWPGQRMRRHFPDQGEEVAVASSQLFSQVAHELSEYFGGSRTSFTVPLEPGGDAFSVSVWQLLLEIPAGATTTYGDIAERMGNRRIAQRVGQAVGANPIGLMIPCHRVLGADGSLTGFAGGLETKRWLLDHERLKEPAVDQLF